MFIILKMLKMSRMKPKFKKAYIGFTKYNDNPWITYDANPKNRYNNKRLGWKNIKLYKNPFSKLEMIEWHHIDTEHIVAIPRDLHRLYLGEYHREMTMDILKQIYLDIIV